MDPQSTRARIEHETAQLRAGFAHLTECHTALVQWTDGSGERRYSLKLDIRWPDHQTLVSGPAHDNAEAAISAGFRKAEEQLR